MVPLYILFLCRVFPYECYPSFIHGVSGEDFPTPFADPPGKGLSSPVINVLWALFNIIIGYWLFKAGKVSGKNKMAILVFFAGIIVCSIALSIAFGKN